MMMSTEKPENGLDGILTFVHEHPDDNTLFFDVLCDHFAGNRKPFQQRIKRVRSSPVREPLCGFDSRPVLALGFRQALNQPVDLFC